MCVCVCGCVLCDLQAGVEVGDVLDELCGTPVHGSSHGKLKQHLAAHSIDSSDFVIVKVL